MKLKDDQRGIAHVGIMLVLVIVAVIVVVGYNVYRNSKANKEGKPATSQNTSADTKKAVSETTRSTVCGDTKSPYKESSFDYSSWKSYSDNTVEFKYPVDWEKNESNYKLEINTKDFAWTGMQQQYITRGARIIIDVQEARYKDSRPFETAENAIARSKIFPSSDPITFSTIMINGKTACEQATSNDEYGDFRFTVQYSSDVNVSVQLGTAEKAAPTAEQLKVYEAVNASIKIK